jgi:1-acyl-sn-glycerol-3-phosphate acyltransferase
MFYTIAKFFGRGLFALTGGIRIYGKARLPERGPLIIACNHQSIIDPLVLMVIMPYKITFLAASYLFKIPILGMILRGVGAMPINNVKVDYGSLKRAIALLKKGKILGIFPEGKVSLDGQIKALMPGWAYMALKTGTGVLPVVIKGSREVLPVGTYVPRRNTITVYIGQALYIEKKDKIHREDMAALNMKLEEELERLMQFR